MSETKTPDDLIDITEAAALMGRNRNTVRREILAGRLPGWKVLGRIVVSRRDALAAVAPVRITPKKGGGK